MESDFRNEAPEGFFLTNVPYEGYKKKTFKTEYEMMDTIGKGACSEVRKCRLVIYCKNAQGFCSKLDIHSHWRIF